MSTIYKLSAQVPTQYQSRSIQAWGMPITNHGNGMISASMHFDTKKEAVEFAIRRIKLADCDDAEREISYMELTGCARIDACSADIEEIEVIENN